MSATETEGRVLGLLGDHLRTGIQPTPETDIVADTGMDSVAVMDFVLDLEEAFDITIPIDRLHDVRTVSDIVAAIERITKESAQ
jgi:acyl carrier protein